MTAPQDTSLASLIEKLTALKKPINNDRFDYRYEREHNQTLDEAIAIVRDNAAPQEDWQPLETAPVGYDGKTFNHILFRGVSKARSFSGPVFVSGWMDNDRKPVHEYSYKLIITGWKPLSVIESEAA